MRLVKKTVMGMAVSVMFLNLGFSSDANAITLGAKCEVNASRSKITVTASGLRGTYWAIALSGGVARSTKAKTTSAAGVVSFSYDSNPTAIAAGATAIPAGYIKNNYVIARLRDAFTSRLIGAVGPTCTVLK